jgi:signal transduction histidine kinase
MTSITRTLTISLSFAAAAIFIVMLCIVIWLSQKREGEHAVCQTAAAILEDATTVDSGRPLTVHSTHKLDELKFNSPDLWYVVSNGALTNEFGSDRRPELPFTLPYNGPFGFSTLSTLDQKSVFCLAVVRNGSDRLVIMIGNAQIHFAQIARSFVLRGRLTISLAALAFALTVALGVLLSARFVSRSIARATELALAIDPAAPQGSIALDQVPLELKPLVQALNRSFDEIDAYIRMQQRFLGNAAHQLRTPLTVLRAKIDDVTEPAIRAELVRDVRRLTSLISAMLDLARLQNHAIEKQPFDLAIVTRDVLADLGPSALDAGIELSLEADEGIAIVQGVEAAIRSALANLVGNALIHARGARHIVARLSAGSVSITDDGPGISPNVRDELLEPFQRGNCAKDSAGLGLSIVQEIMAAHGGELIMTSAPGAGTSACLRFPEAAVAARNEASFPGIEPT